MHSTMPAKKQRVSVLRIPRQSLHQTNSNERQEEIQPDPAKIQLKPQPPPEPNPSVIQVKPRHLPERDPSPPIQIKPRPLPEPDPPIVRVKPRSPPEPDKTPPKKKEHNDVSRRKSNVFTLDRPQTSDSKSNDLNLRTAGLSRSSLAIQQQPTQVNTWIKSSSHNFVRPELNWVATNQWSHGLCECSKDCNMCCYACACWCCFRHEISTMMGEHWCLWFITPLPLMDLRTKFRQQYAIEGSIAGDFCVGTFCPLCVAVQIANEARDYGHRIFS